MSPPDQSRTIGCWAFLNRCRKLKIYKTRVRKVGPRHESCPTLGRHCGNSLQTDTTHFLRVAHDARNSNASRVNSILHSDTQYLSLDLTLQEPLCEQGRNIPC
ncbi:hypothetical protein J6590_016989 [Homalodisca vitripennis]|nr:hypothetical protein J6590_016989 [Homalodisca vitripennis]